MYVTSKLKTSTKCQEDSRAGEETQWHAVWDKIFPGEPKPKSPYVGNIFAEYVEMQHDYMADFGHDVVSRVLLKGGLPNDKRDLGILLRELHGVVLEEISSWLNGGGKRCLIKKT